MAIAFRYVGDGEMLALRPAAAEKAYEVDGVYWLEESNARSMKSHRHEFAWLAEAWKNLPENLQDLYPSSEHLRKRALIQAGYFDEKLIDCGQKATAQRLKHEFQLSYDFALVIARGKYVVIRTAKSQSKRAMGSRAFQESKTAILQIVSELLGVDPASLTKSAETTA